MDAHALLTAQGWRGKGHTLHPTSDGQGLAHHILIKRNSDGSGLGSRKDHKAEAWWLNAFDQALAGIDTSNKAGAMRQTLRDSALSRITARSVADKYTGSRGLYSCFVPGGTLAGSVGKGADTENEQDGDRKAKREKHEKKEKKEKREKKEKKEKKSSKKEKTTLVPNAAAGMPTPPDSGSNSGAENATVNNKDKERGGETKAQRKARREEKRKRKAERRIKKYEKRKEGRESREGRAAAAPAPAPAEVAVPAAEKTREETSRIKVETLPDSGEKPKRNKKDRLEAKAAKRAAKATAQTGGGEETKDGKVVIGTKKDRLARRDERRKRKQEKRKTRAADGV